MFCPPDVPLDHDAADLRAHVEFTKQLADLGVQWIAINGQGRSLADATVVRPALRRRRRRRDQLALIISAAPSATAIALRFVGARGMVRNTDASATRRPSIPCTRSWSSTTAVGSVDGPIRHVLHAWYHGATKLRAYCSSAAGSSKSASLEHQRAVDEVGHVARRRHRAREPQAFDEALEVGALVEQVELDARLLARIGRREGDAAPAPRLVHAAREHDDHRHAQERLEVGRRAEVPEVHHAHEQVVVDAAARRRAARAELELRGVGVGRVAAGREEEEQAGMVGEPVADGRVVDEAFDAERAQVGGGTDAGAHEQRRRVDRAHAQDHLAGVDGLEGVAALDEHAGGAPVVDEHLVCLRADHTVRFGRSRAST